MIRRDSTATTIPGSPAWQDLRPGARERTACADDLREMIVDARQEIVEAGRTAADRAELAADLRTLLDALAVGAPDLALVRDRWTGVRDTLGPAADSGRPAQITDMVLVLFRSR